MEQVLAVVGVFVIVVGALIGLFSLLQDIVVWGNRRRAKRTAEETSQGWSAESLNAIMDAIKENTGVLRESIAIDQQLTIVQQSQHKEIVKVLSPMLDNSGKSTAAVERIRDQFKVMGKAMGIDPQKDYAQFIHDNAEEDSQDMVNEMVIEEMRNQGIPYKAALSNVKSRLAYRSNGR